ncbi:hypothetical protein FRC20_004869 [Serendipita sp. 405]|nr:hypothetical protein FRC20_004869 [Serendipita sp. 405]
MSVLLLVLFLFPLPAPKTSGSVSFVHRAQVKFASPVPKVLNDEFRVLTSTGSGSLRPVQAPPQCTLFSSDRRTLASSVWIDRTSEQTSARASTNERTNESLP